MCSVSVHKSGLTKRRICRILCSGDMCHGYKYMIHVCVGKVSGLFICSGRGGSTAETAVAHKEQSSRKGG